MMSTPNTTSPTSISTPSRPAAPSAAAALKSSELITEHGRTTIADSVVQKIAGVAANEVSGVYKLGNGAARAFGAIRERIPGSGGPAVTQGVSVEVGERQAAIDLALVVEYGVSIIDLTAAVRRNVLTSVERMTGLEVTEVNISVDDIHLPSDDDEDDAAETSRVR
jgi:uncharacterized alkaline shock family protein YloU